MRVRAGKRSRPPAGARGSHADHGLAWHAGKRCSAADLDALIDSATRMRLADEAGAHGAAPRARAEGGSAARPRASRPLCMVDAATAAGAGVLGRSSQWPTRSTRRGLRSVKNAASRMGEEGCGARRRSSGTAARPQLAMFGERASRTSMAESRSRRHASRERFRCGDAGLAGDAVGPGPRRSLTRGRSGGSRSADLWPRLAARRCNWRPRVTK